MDIADKRTVCMADQASCLTSNILICFLYKIESKISVMFLSKIGYDKATRCDKTGHFPVILGF